MTQPIRAFIALELSPDIKNQLHRLQDKLRLSRADVKWIEPENIHLTLRFLGVVPGDKIKTLTDSLSQVLKGFQPFDILITQLGSFPSLSHPRIIWVGVGQGAGELTALAGVIEDKLRQLGFPAADHPFSAHITIGRIRSAKNLGALTTLLGSQHLAEPLAQPVDNVTLFKSTLTPRGPIYETISTIELTKGGL